MFIRRHEAVFLALVAMFSLPFLISGSDVRSQTAAAATPTEKNMDCKSEQEWTYKLPCKQQEKDAQGKPTKRVGGKDCPCKKTDKASKKTVTGKCVAEFICEATKTAEGEKPQTCIDTQKCTPGQTSPEQQQKGGEPKMPELPKPPGGGGEGGGGQPKPNDAEKKQEEIPRPNEEPKPDGALIRSEGVPVPDKQEEKTEEAKDHTDPFATEADMKDRADLPAQAAGDKSNVTDMHEQSQADATGFNTEEKEELSQAREDMAEKSLGERLSDTVSRAYDGVKDAVSSAYEGVKDAFGFGDDKQLEQGSGQYDVDTQLERSAGEYDVGAADKPIAAHMISQTYFSESSVQEGGADEFDAPELQQAQTESDQKQYSATVEPLVEEVDQVEVAKDYAADVLENTPLELAKDAAAAPLDTLHTYNENDIEQLTPEPEQSFSAHVEEIWTDAPEQTVAERIAETATVAYEAVTETVQTTAQRITNFFRRLF